MFCILLRASRILDGVLLHALVIEPAWQKSHKGEWIFTRGDSDFWVGKFFLAFPGTLRMHPENLLPFQKCLFLFG